MPDRRHTSEFKPSRDDMHAADIAFIRTLVAVCMLNRPRDMDYLLEVRGIDLDTEMRRVLPYATHMLVTGCRNMIKRANPKPLRDHLEDMEDCFHDAHKHIDETTTRVVRDIGDSIPLTLVSRKDLMQTSFGQAFWPTPELTQLPVVCQVLNPAIYRALCRTKDRNFGGLQLNQLMGGIALAAEFSNYVDLETVTVLKAHSPIFGRPSGFPGQYNQAA